MKCQVRVCVLIAVALFLLFCGLAIADESDLVWSTFLGDIDFQVDCSIAVDDSGNVYVTGSTWSSGYPTTAGAFDNTLAGYEDAFVTKLNATGSSLEYSTFLGGNSMEYGQGIAVNDFGNAYVTGHTYSDDFPVTDDAYDTSYNATYDVFVVKLNLTGSGLEYATFLGGNDDDYGKSIALDHSGHAYVTGVAMSSNFPTTSGSFDTTYGGGDDVFVVKFNPTGTDLEYATFLGSGWGRGIAVDNDGRTYITGRTSSSGFPTTAGAFDATYNGYGDVFVAKLNPLGSALDYATFLGGSNYEWSYGIEIDGTGNAYVIGNTESANFPTTHGAFDTSYNGGVEYYAGDVFIAKLNTTGSNLVYGTFLGGSDDDGGPDRAGGIAVDGKGYAYLVGYTKSDDFPTTPGALDETHNSGDYFGYDAFIVKLNPTGSSLAYSTFLGGIGDEEGHAITIDDSSNIYITGWSWSADFPTTPGVFNPTYAGSGFPYSENFVAKLDLRSYPMPSLCYCYGGCDSLGSWHLLDYFGDPLEESDYAYAAWTGPDGAIDPPATSKGIGAVSGDDVLLTEGHILFWGGFEIIVNVWHPGDGHPEAGELIYCRIFDGPQDELTLGNYYGDSQLYQCQHVDGEQFICVFPGDPGYGHTDTPLAPLSIDLLSFQALGQDGAVLLRWKTASETDCFGFHIERSVDLENYLRVTDEVISGAGTSETENTYSYLDQGLTNGITYYYHLISVDLDGTEQVANESPLSATPMVHLPKDFSLAQNYPNPFNPVTEIRYSIPKGEHVTLKVYNILGAEVATLVDADQEASFYTVRWDAKNLASGVYFCRLQAGDFEKSNKMVLVK